MSNSRRLRFTGWSPLRPPLGLSRTSRHSVQVRDDGSTVTTSSVPVGAERAVPVVALGDGLLQRARDLAQELLTTMDDGGRRWRHTQAVAARAEQGAAAVAPEQVDLLLAACWLHDVGYAPQLVDTGFHPVDGAQFLQRELWPPALAGLVAHHSGARFMARVRRLEHLMAPYDRPGYCSGPVADALTWADQTTGPDGGRVTAQERIAEVLRRHGPDSAQARSHAQRGPALLAAVRATEERLEAARLTAHG